MGHAENQKRRTFWLQTAVFSAWLLLALLPSPSAQAQRAFKKQRKYVAEHVMPPSEEIPVAPEGMPQPEAAPGSPEGPPADTTPAPVPGPPPGPRVDPGPASAGAAMPGTAAFPAPGWVPPGTAPLAPATPMQPAPPSFVLSPQPLPPLIPVPSGYVLVPIDSPLALQQSARSVSLLLALGQLDRRLGELPAERESIGGPVTQMVIGYSSALVFTSIAAACFEGAANAADFEELDGDDGTSQRRAGYALATLAAASAILGISGTLKLVRHIEANRSLKLERRGLLARRAALAKELGVQAGAGPGQAQLVVKGRF